MQGLGAWGYMLSYASCRISGFSYAFLALGLFASAQDVIPKLEIGGAFGTKIYQEVRVLNATSAGLKISHSSGLVVIPFDRLPSDLRAKYQPTSLPSDDSSPTTAPPDTKAEPSPSPSLPSLDSFDPKCLVFIIAKSNQGIGSGTGFIMRVSGVDYVYTNAHVLCGTPGGYTTKIESITTASGVRIPIPYELELSETSDPNAEMGLEDVARFPINLKDVTPYEIGTIADSVAVSGQTVVAYGNSLGAGVMTALEGKVIGLGNDCLEISCGIVPGNSGGPVVLSETKKVIGISTYADSKGKRDLWAKGTRFEEIRRFAVRPDKVTKWRKMQLTSLISSLTELSNFERDTLSLSAACSLNPRPNRAGFEAPSEQRGDYNIRDVIVGGSALHLGGTISNGIAKTNERLGRFKAMTSYSTVVPIFAEFFATVSAESTAQSRTLGAVSRAPYIKKKIPALLKERAEIQSEFEAQAQRFR